MFGGDRLLEIKPMSAEDVNAGGDVDAVPDTIAAVVEVDAGDVYELRRDVLRRGTPTDDVMFDADDDAATRHFAVRNDDGDVVATSTWSERECPHHPGTTALQLRGMAVRDDYQRRGLGAALVDAGIAFAGERGIELVWANARDAALAFYAAKGFTVIGDGFLTADTRIPHHVIARRV
jgi:GNAT superfamily N-acetyltransferase